MPVASRRTLPPRPRPSPLRGWVLLAAVVAFLGWLIYLQPFFAVACAAIFVFGCLAALWERHQQAKVAAQRPGESICTFARGFDYRRTDTRVIRAVYEELQPLTAFPLRASDKLEDDLKLDGEDLDLDIVPTLIERMGRSLDDAKNNPYWGRVHTVADLVAFFCAQPLARR